MARFSLVRPTDRPIAGAAQILAKVFFSAQTLSGSTVRAPWIVGSHLDEMFIPVWC
jgi:hypothetical protein